MLRQFKFVLWATAMIFRPQNYGFTSMVSLKNCDSGSQSLPLGYYACVVFEQGEHVCQFNYGIIETSSRVSETSQIV